jgi:hypothetical protein
MSGWIRRGPRYSTMKTVCQEIWGPVEYVRHSMTTRIEERTQVLDVYSTFVADTCVVDLHIGPIGNCRAIATLCDPQAMDIEL